MYVLKEENSTKPFAIISNGAKVENFKLAIKEEHSLLEVNITNILLPDWGDVDYFNYKGVDENGTELNGLIQVTKLVTY